MKRGWLAVMVFLAGCATVPLEDEGIRTVQMPTEGARRFVSLQAIHEGMSRSEVFTALGEQIVVGYELESEEEKRYRPLTIKNPYRTEKLEKGRRSLEIDYYLVAIQSQDDQITDDELVPLVFENGRLVGHGWEYLQNIKGR